MLPYNNALNEGHNKMYGIESSSEICWITYVFQADCSLLSLRTNQKIWIYITILAFFAVWAKVTKAKIVEQPKEKISQYVAQLLISL